VKTIVGAAAVVILVSAWRGDLAGWPAAWHAHRGARAPDVDAAMIELGKAVDANPLSRAERRAYERAVEAAIARLGTAKVAATPPRGTVARALLADALDRHGDAAGAGAVRAGVTRTRPEEIELLPAPTLRALGVAAAIEERCDAALPLLDEAVARGGNDVQLRFHYASCLYKAGDWRRALPELAIAYVRNPWSRWGQSFLADTHRRLGNLDEAEAMSRGLTARAPDFYYGWRVRGDVLAGLGRWQEAADSYRRAFALRPENDWLRWSIRRMEKKLAAAGSQPPPPPAGAAGTCEARETSPCS